MEQVNFSSLTKALNDRGVGCSFTYAGQLLNAVRCSTPDELLSDIGLAEHLLDTVELENLFDSCGIITSHISDDVSPRDILFALKILVHLDCIRVHSDPTIIPSWPVIADKVKVGFVYKGVVTRQIAGGYLVEVQIERSHLPIFMAGDFKIDVPSDGLFVIESVNQEEHRITCSFA